MEGNWIDAAFRIVIIGSLFGLLGCLILLAVLNLLRLLLLPVMWIAGTSCPACCGLGEITTERRWYGDTRKPCPACGGSGAKRGGRHAGK